MGVGAVCAEEESGGAFERAKEDGACLGWGVVVGWGEEKGQHAAGGEGEVVLVSYKSGRLVVLSTYLGAYDDAYSYGDDLTIFKINVVALYKTHPSVSTSGLWGRFLSSTMGTEAYLLLKPSDAKGP